MGERDSRKQKVIEEFVLVNNEKDTVYEEKNVKVEKIAIGKKGPVFRAITEDGVEIGIIGDDKKLKKTDEYEKFLMEKLGPYYKVLGLDSGNLEADVMEMVKEQQDKEKQDYKEQDNERQRRVEEQNERQKQVESNNEPKREQPENVVNNQNEITKNYRDNNQLVLTRKELQQHQFALIKDRDFAREIVPNSDEYDFSRVCIVMVDGKPKVMAQINNTDEFAEIPTYMGAKTEMGQIDSIENGEEKEDIGKGDVITLLNRNGERVKIDARFSGGEIEVRDITDDKDNDGDKEGTLIDTRTYTSTRASASKVAGKELSNKEKEDLGITTSEVNSDEPLTNSQIKEMLDESEVSENGRRNIIEKISGDIKKDELQSLINNELAKEENQYGEQEEEKEDDGFDYEAWKAERNRR